MGSWKRQLAYTTYGFVIANAVCADELKTLFLITSKEDAERFTARAETIVRQFDAYPVVDTLKINGKLTLGENLADLAGLTIAYQALEEALRSRPSNKLDGFTPEQRFFLGWAQVWRWNVRPEALRSMVRTNSHAPNNWRVNGPLSNMPEFAQAFGCQLGDPMVHPESDRTRIW
jgi:putative endopeptidase